MTPHGKPTTTLVPMTTDAQELWAVFVAPMKTSLALSKSRVAPYPICRQVSVTSPSNPGNLQMTGKNFCPPSVFVTRCEIPPHVTSHPRISRYHSNYHVISSPHKQSLVRVALGVTRYFLLGVMTANPRSCCANGVSGTPRSRHRCTVQLP